MIISACSRETSFLLILISQFSALQRHEKSRLQIEKRMQQKHSRKREVLHFRTSILLHAQREYTHSWQGWPWVELMCKHELWVACLESGAILRLEALSGSTGKHTCQWGSDARQAGNTAIYCRPSRRWIGSQIHPSHFLFLSLKPLFPWSMGKAWNFEFLTKKETLFC